MAAPLLIDRNQLVKSVILAVLVAVLCLIIGFLSGYHVASSEKGGARSFRFVTTADDEYAREEPIEMESSSQSEQGVTDVPSDVSIYSSQVNASVSESSTPPVIEEQEVRSDAVVVDPEPGLDDGKPSIVDTATAEESRYAIQVGLYGSQGNAERRVDELVSQGFSGYLKSFDNDSGKTLYNVRLGHFNDNASAVEALNIFKDHYDGEGYVTRIE